MVIAIKLPPKKRPFHMNFVPYAPLREIAINFPFKGYIKTNEPNIFHYTPCRHLQKKKRMRNKLQVSIQDEMHKVGFQ